MFVLAVIWLLSSGQLQAAPWLYTQTIEDCRAASKVLHSDPDKLLFFTVCISKDDLSDFRVFDFTLKPWSE